MFKRISGSARRSFDAVNPDVVGLDFILATVNEGGSPSVCWDEISIVSCGAKWALFQVCPDRKIFDLCLVAVYGNLVHRILLSNRSSTAFLP